MQKRDSTFDKTLLLPWYDSKGRIKGSQLVLTEDEQVMKMLDQDKNTIYD